MRRGRGGSQGRIVAGRDEAAVAAALEDENPVRQDVGPLHRLAKPVGHGAEILADDRATLAAAFERDETQQIAKRIMDVSPPRGRKTARDPIEPLQAHHMIDAQDPRVPHIGAQRGDQRGKAAPAQGQRVDRREPPILAGPGQQVGRCADRRTGDDQLPVGPGFGAVRVDPDREVAIEPDSQPTLAPGRRRGAELMVALPLQELKKRHPFGMLAGEFGDRGRIGVAHLLRPGVPRERPARRGEMLVQRLEGGKRRERVAALKLERTERGAERAAAIALAEAPVERLEHRAFQRGDRGVIDQTRAARRKDRIGRRQRPRSFILGKAGDLGHVDVKIIEPDPARWRIRAEMTRLGGEQRVQRVDPDRAGAEPACLTAERCQIAEIADPPIARAAYTVKLGGEAPVARARPQCIGEMAGIGRDDEADFRRFTDAGNGEAVIAEWQSGR